MMLNTADSFMFSFAGARFSDAGYFAVERQQV